MSFLEFRPSGFLFFPFQDVASIEVLECLRIGVIPYFQVVGSLFWFERRSLVLPRH